MNKKKQSNSESSLNRTRENFSNYQNWLENDVNSENLLEVKSLEEDSSINCVNFNKSFLQAFSCFLSSWNPDYYYNGTYLPSFFDEFIIFSRGLILRMNLLNKLIQTNKFEKYIRKFDKNDRLNYDDNLNSLIINIDEVITCTLERFDKKEYPNKLLNGFPVITINTIFFNKEILLKEFNISYQIHFKKDKSEFLRVYDNVFQESIISEDIDEKQNRYLKNSRFNDFSNDFNNYGI